VHTRNQYPLQPFKRLHGVEAKRLFAGKRAAIGRTILPVFRFAQQRFNGEQALAHAMVKSHGKPR
jgi:hypothetical protein